MTNPVTEQELIQKTTGARVTLDDVNAAIVGENYFTAGSAATALGQPAGESLDLMTICVLSMKNGFTILGKSACVDPENFNQDIGRRLAKTDAVSQIWALMSYELKSKLHNEQALIDRMAFHASGDMETFIGTKVINAKPMTRQAYNDLRGWGLPKNEDGTDEGFLVEYTDRIEEPRHVMGFKGYISWSPKEVFERAYRGVRRTEAQPTAVNAQADGGSSEKGKEKEETWLDRLKAEFEELNERFFKLDVFVNSPAYKRLPQIDQADLAEQCFAMDDYREVLGRRLNRAIHRQVGVTSS